MRYPSREDEDEICKRARAKWETVRDYDSSHDTNYATPWMYGVQALSSNSGSFQMPSIKPLPVRDSIDIKIHLTGNRDGMPKRDAWDVELYGEMKAAEGMAKVDLNIFT